MRESELHNTLLLLESTPVEATDAAARAKARMLEAFDESGDHRVDPTTSSADDLETLSMPTRSDQDQSAEILSLVKPRPIAEPNTRHRGWIWIPAAAAVVLIVALLGAQLSGLRSSDPDPFDSSEVATGEDGSVADGTDTDEEPVASQTLVEDDLPRLVQGRFSTSVLGGSVSFLLDGPMWLTRHESGLVKFSLDIDDPRAAELVIARPLRPDELLGGQPAIDFLRSGAPGVDGQWQPLEIDGVTSLYWRGRLASAAAGYDDCTAAAVCLPLFNGPTRIGLRPDVTNDFVERPVRDGTVVISASIPFESFQLAPFGAPFDRIIKTIRFSDEDIGGQTG